ncbi:hypothetical protein KKE34_05385 [Patescibacteria group bacterium]|nr:hypothetical protein [Patescibacteria group bacterium]MBU1886004.1 hypothetical protein [Patescibacteria group bacterium]
MKIESSMNPKSIIKSSDVELRQFQELPSRLKQVAGEALQGMDFLRSCGEEIIQQLDNLVANFSDVRKKYHDPAIENLRRRISNWDQSFAQDLIKAVTAGKFENYEKTPGAKFYLESMFRTIVAVTHEFDLLLNKYEESHKTAREELQEKYGSIRDTNARQYTELAEKPVDVYWDGLASIHDNVVPKVRRIGDELGSKVIKIEKMLADQLGDRASS